MSSKRRVLKLMLDFPSSYSQEQLINAVKYAGEINEYNLIKKVINLPSLYKYKIVLEAIKQVKRIGDYRLLKNIFNWPSSYHEDHIMEAIEIAHSLGNEEYLNKVITYPSLFKQNHVTEATRLLFGMRAVPSALTENFEYKKINKMKILISYKTIDKWFASEVSEYLSEHHGHEFVILFDEFEVFPGDSLPEILGDMLDKYDCSIMIWSPDYFNEKGWAKIEKESIIQRRVSEGKRFVPTLLRGNRNIIPAIFRPYVPVDFTFYEQTRDKSEFLKKIKKVVAGIKRER